MDKLLWIIITMLVFLFLGAIIIQDIKRDKLFNNLACVFYKGGDACYINCCKAYRGGQACNRKVKK